MKNLILVIMITSIIGCSNQNITTNYPTGKAALQKCKEMHGEKNYTLVKNCYIGFEKLAVKNTMAEQQNNQLSNTNNNAQMCVGLALLGMGGCNNGGVYTQPQQPAVSPFVNCRTTRDYQGNLDTVCY